LNYYLLIFYLSKIFLFFIICFFIFVGILTSNPDFSFVNCNNPKNICFYNNTSQKVSGYIVSDVTNKNNKQEFILRIFNKNNGNNNILISTYSKEDLFYGDFLSINCDLLEPKNSDGSKFNYVKYLQLKNVYSTCNAKILTIDNNKNKINFYYYLLKWKYFLKNRITDIYGTPYDGLIFGILFGGNYLSKDLSNLFSNAGISHITAVSGYNISIIVSILCFCLLNIGLNRSKIFYFILIFLIVFVLFTGMTASVVRAAIMGICSLLVIKFGRLSNGIVVLFFVGFLMVLLNPLILIYDVGFQLSFLATFGIIFFKPILDKLFIKFPDFLNLKDSLSSTISAFLFTSPIIFINFNSFNLFSIIVNLLVLEYVPLLMLLGIISIFLPQLTYFFAIVIIKYIIFICELFT